MTQRLSALIPIFILNISLTVACTSREAEVSAPEPDVVSDASEGSSDEEVSQENGGSNDATESSDSSPSETEGGSLEQGACEDSFALQCGAQLRINSDEGAANVEYHSACDDTFRFPGKELRYHFLSEFNGQASLEFQRDGGLTTTFMTFIYETSPTTCDLGSSCHAQADDYQQPLEFGVRDGYAYHVFWDPRLFEDTTTGTLTFRCNPYLCGDGDLDPGESCDDGNLDDSDGCSSQCATEPGFACAGEPSVCTETVCGNGIILGTETCDDQNSESGDGCSDLCQIEDGFHCVGEPSLCSEGIAGDFCSVAVSPTEEYLTGNTASFSNGETNYSGACGAMSSAEGPDQWFRFDIPPGKVLSLEPYLAFEGMRTFVVDDCQAVGTSCLQTASGYLSTYLLNNTSASKTVSVAVDGLLTETQGDYRIRQLLRDPTEFPQGDHALNASTISPGTFSASTESNNNLYGGYGGDCLNDNYGFHGFSGGSDRVYALEVGPGQTLSAEVTPEGDWDATVTISADAADLSASCLSWRDEGVARATNTSAAPTTFFVIVDGFHGHSRGRFTLTTAIN